MYNVASWELNLYNEWKVITVIEQKSDQSVYQMNINSEVHQSSSNLIANIIAVAMLCHRILVRIFMLYRCWRSSAFGEAQFKVIGDGSNEDLNDRWFLFRH